MTEMICNILNGTSYTTDICSFNFISEMGGAIHFSLLIQDLPTQILVEHLLKVIEKCFWYWPDNETTPNFKWQ